MSPQVLSSCSKYGAEYVCFQRIKDKTPQGSDSTFSNFCWYRYANINARLRKQNTFLGRIQDLIQDGRQFSVINFTKIFCFFRAMNLSQFSISNFSLKMFIQDSRVGLSSDRDSSTIASGLMLLLCVSTYNDLILLSLDERNIRRTVTLHCWYNCDGNKRLRPNLLSGRFR